MIFPVPGEHDWTRTPGPDIEPPAFKVKIVRKKEKWIKGKFEGHVKNGVYNMWQLWSPRA